MEVMGVVMVGENLGFVKTAVSIYGLRRRKKKKKKWSVLGICEYADKVFNDKRERGKRKE